MVIAVPGGAYGSKPRPVIVVQDDFTEDLTSVVVCPVTRSNAHSGPLRPLIRATVPNGLQEDSFVMIDKIVAIPQTRVSRLVGRLSSEDVTRIEEGLLLLLGLTRDAPSFDPSAPRR